MSEEKDKKDIDQNKSEPIKVQLQMRRKTQKLHQKKNQLKKN